MQANEHTRASNIIHKRVLKLPNVTDYRTDRRRVHQGISMIDAMRLGPDAIAHVKWANKLEDSEAQGSSASDSDANESPNDSMS